MSEKQPLLEIACTAEQATTEPPRPDGGNVSARQKLKAASSTSQPLTLEPYKFSRIEIGPELRKAVSYGQLWRLELEDPTPALAPNRAFTPAARAASLARDSSAAGAPPNAPRSRPDAAPEAEPAPLSARPKGWLGVVIACLLGAVPIITLALVRWQGNGAEVPETPTEVFATAAAATQVSDIFAPASQVGPALTEVEPEVAEAPLEPGGVPAAAAPVARTKSTVAPTNTARPSADRGLASKPTQAAHAPAPVRSSWFHR